jgi:hypothetical protein
MATLQINGATYRVARKMDAFRQLAVASKISPLIASGVGELAPLLIELRRDGLGNLAAMPLDRLGQIITPVSRELAKMSEEDRRLIIGSCLELVDRKEDGREGWARVWSSDANRSMFEEINSDLAVMLRVVALALQEVFSNFLPASLSASRGGAQG